MANRKGAVGPRKKPIVNTVEGLLKAAEDAAAGPISPPAFTDLRPHHLPAWEMVMNSRAKDEWLNEQDFFLAEDLVKCVYRIQEEERILDLEGSITIKIDGREPNPRIAVISELSERARRLMRTLLIQPTQSGRAFEKTRKRAYERDARNMQSQIKGETPPVDENEPPKDPNIGLLA